jgi:hypothetical protein
MASLARYLITVVWQESATRCFERRSGMSSVHLDATVRLTEDVPAHGLSRGDTGVVVSVWLSPRDLSVEVEFRGHDGASAVRALLRADQVEVVG